MTPTTTATPGRSLAAFRAEPFRARHRDERAPRPIVPWSTRASGVERRLGHAAVHQRPGVEYAKASDEHGVLKIAGGSGRRRNLGDKILSFRATATRR